MILYLRVTTPINAIGRVGPPVFGVVMLAIQSYIFFGPPPISPAAAAITALTLPWGVTYLQRSRKRLCHRLLEADRTP